MGLIADEREDEFAKNRHHYSRRIAANANDLIGSWVIVALLFMILVLNFFELREQGNQIATENDDVVASGVDVTKGISGLRIIDE